LISCLPPFLVHGRRLQIYVDYHSLFFTHTPDTLTQLDAALKFYNLSLRYDPPPQSRGKVEHEHQFWQRHLPANFASVNISELDKANRQNDALRHQRTALRVGDDSHVPIGSQRLRLENPPGSKAILCPHPAGHDDELAHAPDLQQKPSLLFTNSPK
jgi:hypothetical protein